MIVLIGNAERCYLCMCLYGSCLSYLSFMVKVLGNDKVMGTVLLPFFRPETNYYVEKHFHAKDASFTCIRKSSHILARLDLSTTTMHR